MTYGIKSRQLQLHEHISTNLVCFGLMFDVWGHFRCSGLRAMLQIFGMQSVPSYGSTVIAIC